MQWELSRQWLKQPITEFTCEETTSKCRISYEVSQIEFDLLPFTLLLHDLGHTHTRLHTSTHIQWVWIQRSQWKRGNLTGRNKLLTRTKQIVRIQLVLVPLFGEILSYFVQIWRGRFLNMEAHIHACTIFHWNILHLTRLWSKVLLVTDFTK